MGNNTTMKEWGLLTGFLLAALVFRLFVLRYQYVITPDGVYYAMLGRNLVSGNLKEGLSVYWPPLYPLLVGLSSLIFQDLEFSGRFVSVLAGSLLVIPVYLWTRNSYGKDAAYLGVFLTIVYPLLTYCSTLLLTESTYMFLFMAGIMTGWSAVSKGNRGAFLLTGLIFGLCYLTKPEAIGYMGLMIIITLITKLFSNQLQFKRILYNVLILLLGFIVLSLPYILYLHQETGRWTISGKLFAHLPTSQTDWRSRWWSLSKDGQGTLADRLYAGNLFRGDLSYNSEPPPTQIPDLSNTITRSIKALKSEYELMTPQILPPFFILLIALGLFRTTWSKERAKKEIYLLLFLISTLTGYAVMVANVRFLVPLLPIFICWASKGIVEIEDWLIETIKNRSGNFLLSNRKLLRMLTITVLLLSLLPRITEPMRAEKWKQPYELKQVAGWIKDHSGLSPLIMSTSPLIAFYSEGRHIYLPDEEYSVVLEYAKRKKVDYIIIDNRSVSERPRLNFLLDEQGQHPRLKLVYRYDEITDYKVFVFKLSDLS